MSQENITEMKKRSPSGCFAGLKKFLRSLACACRKKKRRSGRQEEQQSVEAGRPQGCQQEGSSPAATEDGQRQDRSLPREPLASPKNSMDVEVAPTTVESSLSDIPFIDEKEDVPAPQHFIESPQSSVMYLYAHHSPEPCEHHLSVQPLAPCTEGLKEGEQQSVADETLANTNHQQEDAEAWHLVTKKKSKAIKQKQLVDANAAKAVAASPSQTCGKRACRRRKGLAPHQDSGDCVRQSWAEDTVTLVLPVAANRRRHVIGPRGDTVRQLRQQYPAVRLGVPCPLDLQSKEVTVKGPKSQATAAARDITSRLQAVDKQLSEAAVRQVVVQVAPHMRGYVVGHGGEGLRGLAQQYPRVRVSVPPASDTRTGTVAIRGPASEVAAVQGCIAARLQAARRQRCLPRAQRVPRSVPLAAKAAKAP